MPALPENPQSPEFKAATEAVDNFATMPDDQDALKVRHCFPSHNTIRYPSTRPLRCCINYFTDRKLSYTPYTNSADTVKTRIVQEVFQLISGLVFV